MIIGFYFTPRLNNGKTNLSWVIFLGMMAWWYYDEFYKD